MFFSFTQKTFSSFYWCNLLGAHSFYELTVNIVFTLLNNHLFASVGIANRVKIKIKIFSLQNSSIFRRISYWKMLTTLHHNFDFSLWSRKWWRGLWKVWNKDLRCQVSWEYFLLLAVCCWSSEAWNRGALLEFLLYDLQNELHLLIILRWWLISSSAALFAQSHLLFWFLSKGC